MIYQVEEKTLQKLVEINRLLNLLEIKGANNVSILYATLVSLGETIDIIQKSNGITIDMTKEKR